MKTSIRNMVQFLVNLVTVQELLSVLYYQRNTGYYMRYAQTSLMQLTRMKKPESLSHTGKEKGSRASQYYVITKALAIIKDINEMA